MMPPSHHLPVYAAKKITPGKEPATERQVNFLISLGWRFPIRSKQHAGMLISQYATGQKPHLDRKKRTK